MKILISSFSRSIGKPNPKNYPYWKQLLSLLSVHDIKQIGLNGEDEMAEFHGNATPEKLKELLDWCDIWISVDNFFPHFVQNYGKKKGIVLWNQSDPDIFGYKTNINLLKDRKYLRPDQFGLWSAVETNEDASVLPEEILFIITNEYGIDKGN